MNYSNAQPAESVAANELVTTINFRERTLRSVGKIGMVASVYFAAKGTHDIGGNPDIGLVESAGYALKFGANSALALLSVVVLNKSNPEQ